ncbi:MAG: Holliday junction branch migration protein RuvA [Candidatus Cloacimonetes bacterium]|jgi:holliday junction DNA helicase RuvA|nr:Holliday junction branch migration protein RuvA [Candidatus Cloacimonadota bacterium]
MYSYLKGVLSEKLPTTIVVDCNGVGYELFVPLSTYDKLPETGKVVTILVHYSFNESDGVRLFGFYSDEEKLLFKQLINISKVGPKLALSVLSGLSVADLIHAVQIGDVSLISTVHGIGKKSAERLVIELKDKVGDIDVKSVDNGYPGIDSDIINDAETALLTLGYKRYDIRKIISKLMKDTDFSTSEEITKAAIKALYKKRNI